MTVLAFLILLIGGDATNSIKVDADSQGKVLRVAMDDAVRKMLTAIDGRFGGPAATSCTKCKTELPAGAKACPKCGRRRDP